MCRLQEVLSPELEELVEARRERMAEELGKLAVLPERRLESCKRLPASLPDTPT